MKEKAVGFHRHEIVNFMLIQEYNSRTGHDKLIKRGSHVFRSHHEFCVSLSLFWVYQPSRWREFNRHHGLECGGAFNTMSVAS